MIRGKEGIVSTERINEVGSRVLTAGIDCAQYERNPILLYMHYRGLHEPTPLLPIGNVENLRVENDKLIGTPVFDADDEFAAKIADKWQKGVLRMMSPKLEITETSAAPELLLQGQTRETVTRCKLIEISIVDIGGNDDALQLCRNGQTLELANGAACEGLPLLETAQENNNNINENQTQMKTILLALGLADTATSEQAVAAVNALKTKADKAETLELSAITGVVDAAVDTKKITADQKDHFITLGKSAGIDNLNKTLALMKPANKPTDVINQNGGAHAPETLELKWDDLTPETASELKANEPQKYIALFKSKYGYTPTLEA